MLQVRNSRTSKYDDNTPIQGTPMVEHTDAVMRAIFELRNSSLPQVAERTESAGEMGVTVATNGSVHSSTAKQS